MAVLCFFFPRLAMKKWTDAACLSVTQLASLSANIQMAFYSYNHGDGTQNAFDGPRHILAHACSPPVGQLHFDDSETWTNGTNFGLYVSTIVLKTNYIDNRNIGDNSYSLSV